MDKWKAGEEISCLLPIRDVFALMESVHSYSLNRPTSVFIAFAEPAI
jgi:hypothetical protein